ncbi:hypothetical protein JB92DRAFT_3009572 [Gautieria morchelliformis]|nr:hypothetical protein JB92DRAFT_3009572 [Gautieria morchelliformis]
MLRAKDLTISHPALLPTRTPAPSPSNQQVSQAPIGVGQSSLHALLPAHGANIHTIVAVRHVHVRPAASML